MTLHVFYSLGTQARPVTYHLAPGLAEPQPAPATQAFVLPALAELGWPVSRQELAAARFHLFATEEVLAGEASFAAQAARAIVQVAGGDDRLRQALADAAVEAARPERLLRKRDTHAIWRVVDRVLDTVQDGDEVVLEATNGIRSVTTGILLAAGLLPALRPKVRLRAATYAEIVDYGSSPQVAEVYDITPFWRLFAWSDATAALADRLDAQPLRRLLTGIASDTRRARHEGAVDATGATAVVEAVEELKRVGPALAFGTARDLDRVLGVMRDETRLESLERFLVDRGEPAAGHVLRRAMRLLAPVCEQLPGDALDEARLLRDARFVSMLCDTGRHGDALRLAVEWLINAQILVHGDPTRWLQEEERNRAKAWLYGAGSKPDQPIRAAFRALAEARNAATHGRYNDKHRVRDLTAAMDKNWQAVQHLVIADGALIRAALPAPGPGDGRLVLANAFSLGMLADAEAVSLRIEPIALAEARDLAASAESAVGHEDTAALFADLLGCDVPCRRQEVRLAPGDRLLVGQFTGGRLPTGTVRLPEGAGVRWLLLSV